MSKNIIGIKQADGTFYPILTRGKPAKKRLQITTASDNQTAAQITLFCASDESFSDAEYVDTLMIEGLKPHEKRAVDIDFVVSLDENDELSAEVYDKESGGSTNSAVSLVAIGSNNTEAENTFGISDEPVPFDSDTSSDALGLADLDDFDLPDPATISDDTPVTDSAGDDDLNFDINDPSLYTNETVADDAFADDSSADETYEAIAATAGATAASITPDMSAFSVSNDGYDDIADEYDKTYEDIAAAAGVAKSADEELFNSDDNYNSSEAPDLFSDQQSSDSGFSDFDFLDPNAGKSRIPLVPVICVICAIISLLSCIFIWLAGSRNKEPLQPLVVDKAPAVKYQSVTVVTEKPEPVDAALIDRISSAYSAKEDSIVIIDAPVVVPAPASRRASEKDTKDYQIKWGDTLWDIADTFYKNPWMYEKIARTNNIKNPDFILSGTWIKIPPQ